MALFKVVSTVVAVLFLSGCMSTNTETVVNQRVNGIESESVDTAGKTIKVTKTLWCKEPIATVAVAPMKCKAARCSKVHKASGNLGVLLRLSDRGLKDFSSLGDVMTTMVTTSIEQSGCFRVLDREAIEMMKNEMAMAGKAFTPETPDYLFAGAITSLEHAKKETGLMGTNFTLGGTFSNTETKAKIGIDVRLLDTTSSAITYTKTYRSDTSQQNYAFGALGLSGSGAGAGSLKLKAGLEMEEAVRQVLNHAVHDLVTETAKGRYEVNMQAMAVK